MQVGRAAAQALPEAFYRLWLGQLVAALFHNLQRRLACVGEMTARHHLGLLSQITNDIEHVQDGILDPKALITHRIPLEEVSDAYRIFSAKLDDCIKPVLIPPSART